MDYMIKLNRLGKGDIGCSNKKQDFDDNQEKPGELSKLFDITWKKGPSLPQGFQDSEGGIIGGIRSSRFADSAQDIRFLRNPKRNILAAS